MVIGAGGQVVARIAREASEDLSRVFLRDVKLKLSAKLRTWGDGNTICLNKDDISFIPVESLCLKDEKSIMSLDFCIYSYFTNRLLL